MASDPTLIPAQPPPQTQPHDHVSHEHGAEEHSGVTPQSALPVAAALSDSPPPTSKGERMFNWIAYGGFSGVVTFLLSLPLGYWARYSKGGQQTMKWAGEKIAPLGMSQHSAEDIVMTTALMQGGNIALVPVKIMESRKAELVEKFNEKLGDSCDPETLQAGVKQNWWSLLKSRAVAWSAVYFSLRGFANVAGKEKFNDFEHAFSRDVVCKTLGQPTHINGAETTLYRYGRIAAIDLFASTAAAILLYAGSRVFGNKDRVIRTHHEGPDASAVPAPAQQSTAAPEAASVAEPAPEKRHTDRFAKAESFVQQQALQPEPSAALAP